VGIRPRERDLPKLIFMPPKKNKKRAVVLLSGGLDSATTFFYAKDKGYEVSALIFDYGQRHKKEVLRAQKIAVYAKCDYHVIRIGFPWKGSALLDKTTALPSRKNPSAKEIPATYVPARNIIFLSYAASFAEGIGAGTIFIGANARDYSGYPDCRPEFFRAFKQVLKKGSKTGVEGNTIDIQTPLINLSKAGIIQLGLKLQVPYHLTWSCYQGGRTPCGTCDSCRFRQKGFRALGLEDPALT